MILSKKHKFIFLKGRKVAGTSMEVFLSDVCGPEDIITPISPIDEKYRVNHSTFAAQNYGVDKKESLKYLGRIKDTNKEELGNLSLPKGSYYNHMPLLEVLDNYKSVEKCWYIFAIERSPYSKIISYANMMLKYSDYQKHGELMKSSKQELISQVNLMIENQRIIDVRNIDLYKDMSGKVSAEILRFTDLHEEFKKVMKKLNIKNFPQLPHIKRGLSSELLDPKEIFSRDQLDQINKVFEEEFIVFNYEML